MGIDAIGMGAMGMGGYWAGWLLLLMTHRAFGALTDAVRERVQLRSALLLRRLAFERVCIGTPTVRPTLGRALAIALEWSGLERAYAWSAFEFAQGSIEWVAAGVLAATALWAHPLALLLAAASWALCTLFLGMGMRRTFVAHREWTKRRMAAASELVERIVGHRTKSVQGTHTAPPSRADYEHWSASMDRAVARLRAIPSGALVLGVCAAAATVLASMTTDARSAPDSQAVLAIESVVLVVGALLLGYRALGGCVQGAIVFGGAAASAHALASHAPVDETLTAAPKAGDEGRTPDFGVLGRTGAQRGRGAPLDVREVWFRYADDGEPVLRSVGCTLAPGERLWVHGPSGSGKSTWAAIVPGRRAPTRGTVMAGGLDPKVLGRDGWRTRVALAPQPKDNHLFSATLAFNVLLGRSWPPNSADLTDARDVCEDLGLGPLLGRMPAGLEQVVGDGGWQLSHGERSRVLLARALLQDTDVVVLDDALAALDPETRATILAAASRRCRSLVVVGHA
jgi:ATP-binding cassette subfamily B protein